MINESGIGAATGVASGDDNSGSDISGPLPFFSNCPEIHNSKAPDIPEVMDAESIAEEEKRLFSHPALGEYW